MFVKKMLQSLQWLLRIIATVVVDTRIFGVVEVQSTTIASTILDMVCDLLLLLYIVQCMLLYIGQCMLLYIGQCLFLYIGQCILLYIGQCML